jgi:serpin B
MAAVAAADPDDRAAEVNNAFAAGLYGKLAAADGNVFFSPTSVQAAMAMAAAGARGETAAEMRKVLALDTVKPGLTDAELGHFHARVVEDGKAAKYELSLASGIWTGRGYPFAPDYLAAMKRAYAAEPRQVDFQRNATGAREKINAWVATQTHDRVKELLAPSHVTRETMVILASAAYFDGKWAVPFAKADTRSADFTTARAKRVRVEMMHNVGEFAYGEDEGIQVIDLAYTGGDLRMRIFLPRDRLGLPALEERIAAAQLGGLGAKLKDTRVAVWLPRFTMEQRVDLRETLADMGMTRAFDPTQADFGAMTPVTPFALGFVIHQAYVRVDEQGTEAAAATGVGGLFGGGGRREPPKPPEPKVFRADHPFAFAIVHRKTDAMLFVGRVAVP